MLKFQSEYPWRRGPGPFAAIAGSGSTPEWSQSFKEFLFGRGVRLSVETSKELVPAPASKVSLSTLRPEVATLMKQRSLGGRFRVGELLSLLKEAEAMDVKAEGSSTKAGCFSLVCFICAIVSLGSLPFMAPIFGLLFLASFVMYSRYSGYNIPNDFRNCFVPVLDALRNDIPRKNRVRFELDLTGSVIPAKEVKRPDSGWQGTYLFSNESRTYYEDHWCLFQAKMADGSELRLEFWNEVLELLRIRGRKNKRKYKYKKVAYVRVTLLPAGGKFQWDAGALRSGTLQDVKIKSGEKQGEGVYSLIQKVKHSQRSSCSECGVSPDTTLRLIMQLYSSLSPRVRDGGTLSHG
jgi:hypothetical protein